VCRRLPGRAAELRRIYTAADADAARTPLDELAEAWATSKTRTAALAVWDRASERVIPFLAFPTEIRRIVYTMAVLRIHFGDRIPDNA
jgi:putative transposase